MGLSHGIQDDEIINLFRRGYSIQDIADILSTTYETVKYRLIRNGLLVHRDGKYYPIRTENLNQYIEEIRQIGNELRRNLNEERDRILLKRLKHISKLFGEHNPVGFEIYRNTKEALRETHRGSYNLNSLYKAIKRLDGER